MPSRSELDPEVDELAEYRFQELKKTRNDLMLQNGVRSSSSICSDSVLREMALRLPQDKTQYLDMGGAKEYYRSFKSIIKKLQNVSKDGEYTFSENAKATGAKLRFFS